MSDLGSKAALNSDIDAKVTTNGANENTGARVNDCLNNIVDTLYGSGSAPTATFSTTTNTAQDPGQDTVRFNSGTIGSVTEIALSDVVGGVDKGDLNSRFSGIIQFRPVGTTDTIEFQITSVVHTSWTRYTVTYLKGTLPANGTVMAVRFLPSNTINAAVTTALAGKADAIPTYVARLTQSGTSAPVDTELQNTLGGKVVWSRATGADYRATLTGAFPSDARTVIILDPCAVNLLYQNEAISVNTAWVDADTVGLIFSATADDFVANWFIQITVYPAP